MGCGTIFFAGGATAADAAVVTGAACCCCGSSTGIGALVALPLLGGGAVNEERKSVDVEMDEPNKSPTTGAAVFWVADECATGCCTGSGMIDGWFPSGGIGDGDGGSLDTLVSAATGDGPGAAMSTVAIRLLSPRPLRPLEPDVDGSGACSPFIIMGKPFPITLSAVSGAETGMGCGVGTDAAAALCEVDGGGS
jgi:hypothetical protein